MINLMIGKLFYLVIKCSQLLMQKVFGINDKKVVVVSFIGKSYSDNPRAITERLHDLDPSYIIVWLFKNPRTKAYLVPDYVVCVKRKSVLSLYHLSTAKFWVDNFYKEPWIYKSKSQIYIQTWHGDRGFKKIIYDKPEFNSIRKIYDQRNFDYVTVGSVFAEKVIASAMRYSGKLIKAGTPRCDLLLHDNTMLMQNIKNRLGLSLDCSVVLYAPTFRNSARNGKALQRIQGINIGRTIKKLNEVTSKNWVMLVRAHSGSTGLTGFDLCDSVLDVTNYEDMADLLLISDMLITDYSSCIGDFILQRRPCYLFQDDYEQYLADDRTFYFNISDSPYLIAKNQTELERLLTDLPEFDYVGYCNDILKYYGTYETGNAAKAVCKIILES